MENLSPEMIEKAKTAKSVEELFEIAKAAGIEMTEDDAKTYFAQLNPKSGELSDDDLDNVAGGGCSVDVPVLDKTLADKVRVTSGQTCKKCGTNVGLLKESGRFYKATCVWCDACDKRIAYADECTYEVIG